MGGAQEVHGLQACAAWAGPPPNRCLFLQGPLGWVPWKVKLLRGEPRLAALCPRGLPAPHRTSAVRDFF